MSEMRYRHTTFRCSDHTKVHLLEEASDESRWDWQCKDCDLYVYGEPGTTTAGEVVDNGE